MGLVRQVKQRTLPKSISCGKTFQGPNKLKTLPEVHRWLKELGRELEERVAVDRAENAREPKLLTVHAGWPSQISRSCALRRPTADVIAEDCLGLVFISWHSRHNSLFHYTDISGQQKQL